MTDEYIRIEDVVNTINANADDLEQNGGIPYAQGARAMAVVVEQMPPADVTPVVHSRWSDKMERVDTYHPFAGFETDYYHRCLNCGRRGKGFSWNFCPYCGAKMDGEE